MSQERQALPHDEKIVKAALQDRILGVLDALGFKDEAVRNGVITPLNPRRKDRRPGSFVIWLKGSAGSFKDYSSGEKGDVFDLIQFAGRLDRWIDAYWWSLNFLGWGRHEVRTADQVKQAREDAERERKAAEARADAEAKAKGVKAKMFWLGADDGWWPKDGCGSGPVWRYLKEARGLPLERLDGPPGAIRQLRVCEHFDRDTGEITEWPAMATAISGPTGLVTGVHITWLAAPGTAGDNGKAPVETAKKMRGVVRGGAIRLSKGASGLTPEAAARKGVTGPLIITEGIEDALTAAIARPADRVWAAGSLSLLGELAWPDCASSVVLVADNDWLKPGAVKAFEAVEATWRAMANGRPLKVVRADVGKDLNDWARGRAVDTAPDPTHDQDGGHD